MSWTLIQARDVDASTLAFLSSNAAGNLIIAWISAGVNTGGGAGITVSNFSDTAGNTYLNPASISGVRMGAGKLFCALSCKAGPNTLSFSFSAGNPKMIIAEYSSSTGASALDSPSAIASAQQNNGSGVNQINFTAAQNGELTTFFDANYDAGTTWTPAAGYTVRNGSNTKIHEDNQNTSAGANTSGGTWSPAREAIFATASFQNAALGSSQRTLVGVGL